MFYGSMVAIVTPMSASNDVDYDAFSTLIEWHIEQGTDGIVVLGTTGESATLRQDERTKLIQLSMKQINSRVPLIVGTGTNATHTSITLTKQAMELGADAALLVTPYYNKPTQDGLYQHYRAIAHAVALPQILYNVPGRTGCDLQPETIARLADIPNIVAVKEATGDVARVAQIKALCGDKLDLFSGDDATGMDFVLAGGKGVISVTANIAPKAMHDLIKACLEQDREQAASINQQLMPLHEKLFVESNPIPAKWALHRMGKIASGIRLPLTELSPAAQGVVESAMQQAGVI